MRFFLFLSGIELDVRRYVTALLAALHLAKVTSEQQQTEDAKASKPQEKAEPATNEQPSEDPTTKPTTAEKVKSTPEAKSASDN